MSKHKANPASYLATIKANYPKAEALYEDVIISLVGYNGLIALRESHAIETCALLNGRKLYAL